MLEPTKQYNRIKILKGVSAHAFPVNIVYRENLLASSIKRGGNSTLLMRHLSKQVLHKYPETKI